MTPEQLDEIEKLARTGEPEDDGGGDTAAFLRECHILPLVKAVREAREDAHKHREDALAWMQVSFAHQRERDEARAEVERLREVVRQVHALSGAMSNWPDVLDLKECGAKIHKLTKNKP